MNKSVYGIRESGATSLNQLSDVSINAPANDQVLQYNGTNWVNGNISSSNLVTSVFARQGVVVAQNNDYNISQITNSSILANTANVNINSPSNNQILRYTGTQWANSNDKAYTLVQNFVNATYTALPNTYYQLDAGGTLNIDNLNPGDRVMVTSNANPITIQFGPTYFVLNSNFSGGSAGLTMNITSCTIEFWCGSSFGTQRYMFITNVSQNRNNSICNLAGQKISALNSLNNIPDVNITSAVNGQVLSWNGSAWINSTISGGVTSVFGRSGAVTAANGDYDISQITNSSVLASNGNVFISTPLDGQVLVYDAGDSAWENRKLGLGDLEGVSLNPLAPFQIFVYTGTAWTNLPYSESVTSVFGRGGNVVAQFGDYGINQISGISPLASAGVVSLTSPSTNQLLRFNGTQWVNSTNILSYNGRTGAVVPAIGDYTIAQITNSSVLASTTNVNITTPSNGQILQYNGTQWVNATSGAPVTSVFSRSGSVVAANGDYNISQITNSSVLASTANVNITAPANGQILSYNGTQWINSSLTGISVTSFNSRTGAVIPQTNDYTIAQITNSSFLATTANVNIFLPQDHEALIWDAPSQRIVNRLIPRSLFICYNSAVNLSNGVFFRNTGTGTLPQAAYIIPRQCSLRGITGWVNNTNAAGVGWTFTVTKNGVNVGLAISMLGSLGANSASADINFNQFEFVQVRINIVGAAVTTTGGCTLEFV
jgi:hypothetical protein